MQEFVDEAFVPGNVENACVHVHDLASMSRILSTRPAFVSGNAGNTFENINNPASFGEGFVGEAFVPGNVGNAFENINNPASFGEEFIGEAFVPGNEGTRSRTSTTRRPLARSSSRGVLWGTRSSTCTTWRPSARSYLLEGEPCLYF